MEAGRVGPSLSANGLPDSGQLVWYKYEKDGCDEVDRCPDWPGQVVQFQHTDLALSIPKGSDEMLGVLKEQPTYVEEGKGLMYLVRFFGGGDWEPAGAKDPRVRDFTPFEGHEMAKLIEKAQTSEYYRAARENNPKTFEDYAKALHEIQYVALKRKGLTTEELDRLIPADKVSEVPYDLQEDLKTDVTLTERQTERLNQLESTEGFEDFADALWDFWVSKHGPGRNHTRPFKSPHMISGRHVNLETLWKEVNSRGGMAAVTQNKRWTKIGTILGRGGPKPPPTNVGRIAQKIYDHVFRELEFYLRSDATNVLEGIKLPEVIEEDLSPVKRKRITVNVPKFDREHAKERLRDLKIVATRPTRKHVLSKIKGLEGSVLWKVAKSALMERGDLRLDLTEESQIVEEQAIKVYDHRQTIEKYVAFRTPGQIKKRKLQKMRDVRDMLKKSSKLLPEDSSEDDVVVIEDSGGGDEGQGPSRVAEPEPEFSSSSEEDVALATRKHAMVEKKTDATKPERKGVEEREKAPTIGPSAAAVASKNDSKAADAPPEASPAAGGNGQKDVDSPATGGTVICITETGKPLPAGEEASLKFLTSLRRFILLKTDGMELGIGAYRIPRMGKEEVNLPQLYRSVVMCGGYHKTIQKKGSWKVVAFHMRVPSTVTNAAYMLRVHYEKFLLEYEYTFWDNPDIEMDLLRNTRFTREQVLLSPVPSGPPKKTDAPKPEPKRKKAKVVETAAVVLAAEKATSAMPAVQAKSKGKKKLEAGTSSAAAAEASPPSSKPGFTVLEVERLDGEPIDARNERLMKTWAGQMGLGLLDVIRVSDTKVQLHFAKADDAARAEEKILDAGPAKFFWQIKRENFKVKLCKPKVSKAIAGETSRVTFRTTGSALHQQLREQPRRPPAPPPRQRSLTPMDELTSFIRREEASGPVGRRRVDLDRLRQLGVRARRKEDEELLKLILNLSGALRPAPPSNFTL